MKMFEITQLRGAAQRVKDGFSDCLGGDYCEDVLSLIKQHNELLAVLQEILNEQVGPSKVYDPAKQLVDSIRVNSRKLQNS